MTNWITVCVTELHLQSPPLPRGWADIPGFKPQCYHQVTESSCHGQPTSRVTSLPKTIRCGPRGPPWGAKTILPLGKFQRFREDIQEPGAEASQTLHYTPLRRCIGEGNGKPLQYSCLENPRDGGAWWAAILGSHRVGHDWSDLAAAAARQTRGQQTCLYKSRAHMLIAEPQWETSVDSI